MKKISVKTIFLVMVVMSLILTGCSGEASKSTNQSEKETKTETSAQEKQTEEVKVESEASAPAPAEETKVKTEAPTEKAEQTESAEQEESITAKVNMGSAEYVGELLTVNTIVTNTNGNHEIVLKETDISLKDKDGNIIRPADDRLAQTITIEPLSAKEVGTLFERVNPNDIASIVAYDIDGNELGEGEFNIQEVQNMNMNNQNTESTNVVQEQPQYITSTENGLILWDFEFKEMDGAVYLVGIVENVSNEDVEGIDISFNIYDKDENQIGQSTDYLSKLKAGNTWKFKIRVWEDEASLAELDELSSW